jgi:hypothetical protein
MHKSTRKSSKTRRKNPSKLPTKQGESEKTSLKKKDKVGNKNPPKEHQFPPGVSGNPKGPPKRRTQLWVWFCKYMNMTDAQIEKLEKAELTQAQQGALKLVENAKNGKGSGSEALARHVFDREEGRATEYVVLGENEGLSDEECEEIRQVLRQRQED